MMLAVTCQVGGSLLEGEGVVVLAGLAVPDQVASLFAQPEQRLRVRAADRTVVPAADAIGPGGESRNTRSDTPLWRQITTDPH